MTETESELLDSVRRNLAEWDAPQVIQNLAENIGRDWRTWWHNCHSASIAIVQAQVYGNARVARGWSAGITSQHSWIVIGDPYAPDRILDPTRWSYDRRFTLLEIPSALFDNYRPHGSEGSIWTYGQPLNARETREEAIELVGELSEAAQDFLSILSGPLGRTGWSQLAHAPVSGWPAGDVFSAMSRTPKLEHLVPIDILGMTTDINPGGLYLPGEEKAQ